MSIEAISVIPPLAHSEEKILRIRGANPSRNEEKMATAVSNTAKERMRPTVFQSMDRFVRMQCFEIHRKLTV